MRRLGFVLGFFLFAGQAFGQGVVTPNTFSLTPFQVPSGNTSSDLATRGAHKVDVQADFGAIADGSANELANVTTFNGQNTSGWTLAQWQTIFPFATALTNEIDGLAIQAAVNASDYVFIPAGIYMINTPVTWGAKSVYFDISPAATFPNTTTTGNFPTIATNILNVAEGPYIQSQSTNPSPANGAVNALTVEMLQPSTYTGQSVALYAGASGSSAGGNVWAFNPLVTANSGATGSYFGAEIDVNNNSSTATSTGILLSGSSTYNLADAIHIVMIGSSWANGIVIDNANIGMQIHANGSNTQSLLLLNTTVTFPGADLVAQQIANNGDTVILRRETDTSPSGYFERFVNGGNTATEWSVDVNGNLTTAGTLTGASFSGSTVSASGLVTGHGITGYNTLNGQLLLSASTTLTASQAGQYIFWTGGSGDTITLPNSADFSTAGGGVFYLRNEGSGPVSIATVSTDHNQLPGGGDTLGGDITLNPGQSVLAISNSSTPGWESGTSNTFGTVTSAGLVTGSNIAAPSVATLATNPPVSGTAYQWAGPGALELACPITLSPTSSAAATTTLDIGSTSTPTAQVDSISLPATAVVGQINNARAEVPSGWYYELTVDNATIGTCTGVVH